MAMSAEAKHISHHSNQHAFSEAEDERLTELVDRAETSADCRQLAQKLDDAVGDPFLPRWYRAKCNVTHACYSTTPEQYLEAALVSVKDMHAVREIELEAGLTSAADIDDGIRPLEDAIRYAEARMVSAEDCPSDDDDETVDRNQIPPPPPHTPKREVVDDEAAVSTPRKKQEPEKPEEAKDGLGALQSVNARAGVRTSGTS